MPAMNFSPTRLRQPIESALEEILMQQPKIREPQDSAERASQKDICRAITTGITSGELAPGEQLPSIRQLSKKLAVAPGVVRRAFEHLLAQGWLEMRHGSGTYVSKTWNLAQVNQCRAPYMVSSKA